MDVQIWIGKEYLDQLHKNLNSPLVVDDVFENAVEYTDLAVMPGQIQVVLKYDKYVELIDKGLLVEWSGIEQIM